ncbi:hypothetical protein KQX54_005714 [Cotesia glomerata]|uniref:Uncharacterized protein n=1 Tax=Cotesia glomerata TaxID=32391 RepID=A0AAV7IXQ6_COTGL|nr:hypothetical protein KQX54_005714 [Cotesia glomerata]
MEKPGHLFWLNSRSVGQSGGKLGRSHRLSEKVSRESRPKVAAVGHPPPVEEREKAQVWVWVWVWEKLRATVVCR